jgi:hypothetical protein
MNSLLSLGRINGCAAAEMRGHMDVHDVKITHDVQIAFPPPKIEYSKTQANAK